MATLTPEIMRLFEPFFKGLFFVRIRFTKNTKVITTVRMNFDLRQTIRVPFVCNWKKQNVTDHFASPWYTLVFKSARKVTLKNILATYFVRNTDAKKSLSFHSRKLEIRKCEDEQDHQQCGFHTSYVNDTLVWGNRGGNDLDFGSFKCICWAMAAKDKTNSRIPLHMYVHHLAYSRVWTFLSLKKMERGRNVTNAKGKKSQKENRSEIESSSRRKILHVLP